MNKKHRIAAIAGDGIGTETLPEGLRGSTRVIRVTSYDSITLELAGDRVVRWGSAEESAAKADALEAVMNAAEDATYFDVSAPSAPAASDG